MMKIVIFFQQFNWVSKIGGGNATFTQIQINFTVFAVYTGGSTYGMAPFSSIAREIFLNSHLTQFLVACSATLHSNLLVHPSAYPLVSLLVHPSLSVRPSHFTIWCFCGHNFSTTLTLIVTNQVVPIGTGFVNHDMLIFMAVWSILNLVAIYLILRY